VFSTDKRRHAIVARTIDEILAPKQAPAPKEVDNRSPREKMIELHPHSVFSGLLREIAAQGGRQNG
jgi:hypothetical protein